MEAYYNSVEKCHDIWRLYHLWYDDKRDPEVLKKVQEINKRGNKKTLKWHFTEKLEKDIV